MGKRVFSTAMWVLVCLVFLSAGTAVGFIGKSKVLSAIIENRIDRTFHIPFQTHLGRMLSPSSCSAAMKIGISAESS